VLLVLFVNLQVMALDLCEGWLSQIRVTFASAKCSWRSFGKAISDPVLHEPGLIWNIAAAWLPADSRARRTSTAASS
jgi:hypothetical protein